MTKHKQLDLILSKLVHEHVGILNYMKVSRGQHGGLLFANIWQYIKSEMQNDI